MLITLSCHTAICQSFAEVYLTDVAPLGPVSHRLVFYLLPFYFTFFIYLFCQHLLASQLLLTTASNDVGLQLLHSGGDLSNFLMRSFSLGMLKFRIL
jgi:hypothetical protein